MEANYADYRDLRPADPDGLRKWRERQAQREEARERYREERERKLDIVPPTLDDIDQRIAAERAFMCEVIGEAVAGLWREWVVEAMGPPGPRGEQGPPGKLPIVKIWRQDSVTYEAEVVCHNGSLYQALKDTGQVPGGSHWMCLAIAGRDAITPQVRGTYKQGEQYNKLDICAMNGSSFIARKDDPGECPGPGWQLLVSRGKTGDKGQPGPRGERGEKGEKGDPVPEILGWRIDRERYVATPVMSDGREGPPLELRGLFEQFHEEAR